ncbi:major capsid protein [Chitiniphilus eburneus]|uniref:major capsid protein n=1 Tax=Chitiniphilus eburneus TaxID=2571148 RepID=UPI0035CEC652
MADINVFQDDAFGVTTLTATINEQPMVPGRLSSLNLFDEEGINTTVVQIEKSGETLALVPAGQRGIPGLIVQADRRNMIPFNTVHLPERASIGADEIQGIRAFGTQSELEAVETVVNKRLAKMRRQLDATHEFHRIGAVKGLILDADGVTPLLNLYSAFGLTQQSLDFELDQTATELRLKCSELLDMVEDALGNTPFVTVRVECGKNFWNKLITHKAVKETYLATQMAASLRGDPREAIEFGGCVFERYRGKVGSVGYVGDDEAYAVPDADGLFISRFAPADYMETVNTTGLPYYAKQERLPFDKGVALEAQSNPLHLCTRPRAVIKLTV